jgi:hypothetical protein
VLHLFGQKGNAKLGDATLHAFSDMFATNVTLLKIVWRLESRQSFRINKLLVRNNDIDRRIKAGKEYADLLPAGALPPLSATSAQPTLAATPPPASASPPPTGAPPPPTHASPPPASAPSPPTGAPSPPTGARPLSPDETATDDLEEQSWREGTVDVCGGEEQATAHAAQEAHAAAVQAADAAEMARSRSVPSEGVTRWAVETQARLQEMKQLHCQLHAQRKPPFRADDVLATIREGTADRKEFIDVWFPPFGALQRSPLPTCSARLLGHMCM